MWGALVFFLVPRLGKTSGMIRGLEHFTLVNLKQHVDIWKERLICSVKLNFHRNKKFLYIICSTEAATFVLQMCIKFCMAPYRKFLLCNGSSLPWHIVANAIQCTLWTVNNVLVGAQSGCLESLLKIGSKGFWKKDPKSFAEVPIISLFSVFLEPEFERIFIAGWFTTQICFMSNFFKNATN